MKSTGILSRLRSTRIGQYTVYIIYLLGCLIASYLFFTMADMTQPTTQIVFILTIILLLTNMWYSTRLTTESMDITRADIFVTEDRAANVVSAIVTMTVLVITLGVRGVFDNTFKYTLLTSIVTLMAVLVIIWIPSNDSTSLRYMRDIKTIMFTIGSMFGILSIYNVINAAPLIPRAGIIQQDIVIQAGDDDITEDDDTGQNVVPSYPRV